MRYFGTKIVKNFVIRIFFANFAWKITIKMLKFISFGSGSSGNCYYLYTDTDSILIDVGVGIRILKKHFHNYGLRFEDVHHVLITHDHADHVKSVGSLSTDYHLPVYTTRKIPGSIPPCNCFKGFASGRDRGRADGACGQQFPPPGGTDTGSRSYGQRLRAGRYHRGCGNAGLSLPFGRTVASGTYVAQGQGCRQYL